MFKRIIIEFISFLKKFQYIYYFNIVSKYEYLISFYRQYFHDAIPMVGTEASVGMIQDLISRKHVTGSEAEMWLLSLSFVHHPSKEMVAAIMVRQL